MLFKQSEIASRVAVDAQLRWLATMVDQVSSRFKSVGDGAPAFPCIFAQNAFARANIQFLAVPFDHGSDTYRFDLLLAGLKAFLARAKEWDGDVNTAEPLLVLFEPAKGILSVKAYADLFIESLQYLINHDDQEWVGGIPVDPSRDFWTMCFSGTQIFINVSHPQHRNRRSRNLCDTLALVINPRERFDVVAGNNRKGHLIRERIRRNIDHYDKIPHSPFLGHYQDGDLEWPQYMLPDTNEEKPMECPLRFRQGVLVP